MNATTLQVPQPPALSGIFGYLSDAAAQEWALRERLRARYYRQLTVGYRDDDQPPSLKNSSPMPDAERAARSYFYRLQLTIMPEMHGEAMRDWFTKIGPPLRLARNWILNRWKNNYTGFSGPKTV